MESISYHWLLIASGAGRHTHTYTHTQNKSNFSKPMALFFDLAKAEFQSVAYLTITL